MRLNGYNTTATPPNKPRYAHNGSAGMMMISEAVSFTHPQVDGGLLLFVFKVFAGSPSILFTHRPRIDGESDGSLGAFLFAFCV